MGQLRDRMEQDLILRKLSPATRRNYLLYCRKFAGHYVPFPRRPRNDFPEVVNRDQLVQLFAALRSPKYRALFLTCYAAGLRISEACALRIEDLDSRFPALLATICVVRLAGGALCRPGASAASRTPYPAVARNSLTLGSKGRIWSTTWFRSDPGRNPLRTTHSIAR